MANSDFNEPVDDVSELWFAAMIRHQTFLMRLSAKTRNDILVLLKETEKDIIARVNNSTLTLASAQRLINEFRLIRGEAWDTANAAWLKDSFELALSEPAFTAGAFQTVVPVVLELGTPSTALLKAIVENRPFAGRTVKAWGGDLKAADLARIEKKIMQGIVQGQSNKDITKEIFGMGGVNNITKEQVNKIVRTTTNGIANAARTEFFLENNDIFTHEMYIATLDSGTTPVCRKWDTTIHLIGKGPLPPLHVGCRSLRIALIDEGPMGERPMKASTEKGILRDFLKENNLDPSIKSAKNLPRGFKNKFTQFSRKKVRDSIGRVPAKTSYTQFLKKQSKQFQNDTMGITKAKLFRDGGLSLDGYVDKLGNELSLSELAGKHADAFRAAGLDPENFL